MPVMSHKKVAVIGAGVSGVAAMRHLAARGVDVVAFERSADIGGLWVYHDEPGVTTAYRSLHTKGPRESFGYPDAAMDPKGSVFPGWEDVVRYLNDYVDVHDLRRFVRFKSTVQQVRRAGEGWEIVLEDGEPEYFDAVVVANGHHFQPRLPEPAYPGEFAGRQYHSHEYSNNVGEANNRVLVVGAGNSAVDIAVDVAWVAEHTFMSIRRGFHLFPQTIFGRPRMYVLDVPLSRLPRGVRQWAIERLLRLATGRNSKYGLPEPAHRVLESRPTISDALLERINNGGLTPKPGIERLDGNGVVFADGSRAEVDTIIWCTGYQISHPFLNEPQLRSDGAYMPLYMHIVPPRVKGLYFVGLVQPVGAMPPIAAAQSEFIAAHLCGDVELPSVAAMDKQIAADQAETRKRFVSSKRHQIEVDVAPYLETVYSAIRGEDGTSGGGARLAASRISWS
jgi:dimethylaniline monooxygenase (N-oxide forming)